MGVESCSSAKLKIKIQEILSSENFPLPFPWPLGGISWMCDVYLKFPPSTHTISLTHFLTLERRLNSWSVFIQMSWLSFQLYRYDLQREETLKTPSSALWFSLLNRGRVSKQQAATGCCLWKVMVFTREVMMFTSAESHVYTSTINAMEGKVYNKIQSQ